MFSRRPVRIAETRVVASVVGPIGPSLLGNQADLERSYGYAVVWAVNLRGNPSTRLQLQDIGRLVDRPNAGESRPQVFDHRFGAALEHFAQAVAANQRQTDICRGCRLAGLTVSGLVLVRPWFLPHIALAHLAMRFPAQQHGLRFSHKKSDRGSAFNRLEASTSAQENTLNHRSRSAVMGKEKGRASLFSLDFFSPPRIHGKTMTPDRFSSHDLVGRPFPPGAYQTGHSVANASWVFIRPSYLAQDARHPVTSTAFPPTVPVKSMPVPP